MIGKRRTILLFVGGLPHHLSQHDLRDFVLSELKAAALVPSLSRNTITHCEILRIVDRKTGVVEHHGLVEIGPPRVAIRAIEILDRKLLSGHQLAVHRYQHRGSWRSRAEDSAAPPFNGHDRRRPHLKRDLLPSPDARGFLAAWASRRKPAGRELASCHPSPGGAVRSRNGQGERSAWVPVARDYVADS